MMDAGATAGGQPQTELLTKTPAQSRTSIVYKFAADDILREHYRDPWNEVRIGKLLEDLDALAGTIAVKVLQRPIIRSLLYGLCVMASGMAMRLRSLYV